MVATCTRIHSSPQSIYWQQTTGVELGKGRHRWKIWVCRSAGKRGWRLQEKHKKGIVCSDWQFSTFSSVLTLPITHFPPSSFCSLKSLPILFQFISLYHHCSPEKFQTRELNLPVTSSWGAIHQMLALHGLRRWRRSGGQRKSCRERDGGGWQRVLCVSWGGQNSRTSWKKACRHQRKLGNMLESGEKWPCCSIETDNLPYNSDQKLNGLFLFLGN